MDLGSGFWKKPIPDPGSRIQMSKRHRIPDPYPNTTCELFSRNLCQCCRVRGAAMRLPTGAAPSSSSSSRWGRPSAAAAVQGSSPGGPPWGSRRPPPGPIHPWRGHLMVCSYFKHAYKAVLRIKIILVMIGFSDWISEILDLGPSSDFSLEGCGKFVVFQVLHISVFFWQDKVDSLRVMIDIECRNNFCINIFL